jgi:cobalt-zinc-cadmium efflux system outer membrane protein
VVEVLSARDLKVMRGEESKLTTELAAFIEAAVAKGEGSALDAGQARLGAVQHALEIRQLDVVAATALGEIRSLLGAGPGVEIKVGGELPVPYVPKSQMVSAQARPDYRAAVLAAEAAAREVELEKSKRRQDLEAGIFVEAERTEDAPEGLETDGMIGFRISIPLPFWDKNEGAIEAAEAKQQRMAKEAQAVEMEIQNEAANARSLMAAHAKIIAEIDRDLLPLATKQVALSEKVYREGQGNLQSVLRARDQQIELQTARLNALREFHLARAAFEAASGH